MVFDDERNREWIKLTASGLAANPATCPHAAWVTCTNDHTCRHWWGWTARWCILRRQYARWWRARPRVRRGYR